MSNSQYFGQETFFNEKIISLYEFNLTLIEKIMFLLELPFSFESVLFDKEKVNGTLPEYLSTLGKKQFKIA